MGCLSQGIRVSLLVVALPAAAQTPFVPLADLWISDSNNDRVTRMRDLNFDGDYNDLSESAIYYEDTVGSIALGNNNCITSRTDGSVFVGDTSFDYIVLLQDLNADGDAYDGVEALPYFTSLANAAGIALPSVGGLYVDGNVVWAANSQSGSTGKDTILRLEDLDNDRDANDAGEAREYCVSSDLSLGGTSGDSLALDVQVGIDGNVYYLDAGSTGVIAKGVYKLVDINSNGVIDPPSEVSPFFIPPPQTNTAFFWAIDHDSFGNWYMADTGNDLIWRFRDDDGDGSIDPLTEAVKWWISPAASLVWNVRMSSDGTLYAGETQPLPRVLRMQDNNSNDSIDPATEVSMVYDYTVMLGDAIGQIRGFVLDAKSLAPSSVYCSGQANTLGCTSAMSFLGWPSATFGSGYYLNASNLRNHKFGRLFYGLSGPQSAPFNGGTLCVVAPLVRTPIQDSGGSPSGDDCTGTLSFDFNAYIASAINPALIAGVVVNAQYWTRDPGSTPGNTNLSDAVEFCILR